MSEDVFSHSNFQESFIFDPITKFIKLQSHTKEALNRLSITTVRDLLCYRPTNYIVNKICTDGTKFQHGQQVIVETTILEVEIGSRGRPTKIYTKTSSGPLVLVFFNKIPAFLFSKLVRNSKHIIEGKVEFNQGFYFQITHPQFIFDKKNIHNIEAVYPLTYGITSKQISNYVRKVFDQLDLNNEIFKLLYNLHFPEIINETAFALNVKKLAKYELLSNQIHLAAIRNSVHRVRGRCFSIENARQKEVLASLGFTLTPSQKGVLEEIFRDQSTSYRMVRMLQGDVGSGKTLVALLSMLNVASSGVQSVLMAPTDLLANQHFEFFKRALANIGIRVGLLTGKISTKERKETLSRLEDGSIDILIGTHAVFQEKVQFKDLGYIVIDEQHRFGVEQRMDLINKATMPDLLVMTATPIPRSLTLTLFGDMSCSKLLAKPNGRLPIITSVISKTHIDNVMGAIERKLEKEEKVYWICPLIEQEEEDEGEDDALLMDVLTRCSELNNLYPGSVDFIHGKMKNSDKDAVMQSFKDGKIKIIVATTVIEVGIDVPDATLIIIENAEKFGLAQLHQLRGRVGRSNLQSHAILIYEPKRTSNIARSRMSIIKESDDGFYIAEQDLLLRGGGEILGLKQSGEQEFIFANLATDMNILTECSNYINNMDAKNYHNFSALVRFFAKKDIAEILE